MKHQLNVAKLATLVRNKRAGRGLREIADEIGEVSPSTLSRVENEKAPDMTTFIRICNWLQVRPAELFIDEEDAKPEPTQDTSEVVHMLLRSDKKLDPTAASNLATIFKAAYQSLPKRPGEDKE